MRSIVRIALCLAPWPAGAQTIGNVNDCTLLTDPVSLRRCVDSFGGRIQKPSDQLMSPSVEVARPQPGGRSGDAPATTRKTAAQKQIARPSSGAWLPEARKTGDTIRSKPNSILFDR